MNYARLENGVVMVGPPKKGILLQVGFEGCTTAEYNLLPYESDNPEIPTLKAEGWLLFVDNPPVYNQETEYLEHTGYTIGVDSITVNYTVKPIQPVTMLPTTEERLAAIEEALLMII